MRYFTRQKLTKYTPQKIKLSIKDFFSKCDQIRRKLRIWSNLLKKPLMENFIVCAVMMKFSMTIQHHNINVHHKYFSEKSDLNG